MPIDEQELPALAFELNPQKANDFHAYLKMIDPQQNGVGLDKARAFFGAVGWHEILGHVAWLKATNMLSETPVSGKFGVKFNVYTWKEATNA